MHEIRYIAKSNNKKVDQKGNVRSLLCMENSLNIKVI